MIKNNIGKLISRLMATEMPMDDMIEDMIVVRKI